MSPPLTLATYLLDSLVDHGVSTIFALPGDYVLTFCHEIEKRSDLKLITLSTEAGIGFAAQAHARAGRCLGVACVTYGVGAFSMVNQVACAYAEMVPLVVISGGPYRQEKVKEGILLHHQVKALTGQLNIYEELTCYSAILDDPKTAATRIQEALQAATDFMRPVYLEVPRDLCNAPILHPKRPKKSLPSVDEAGIEEASLEIVSRLQDSEQPCLMVGIEVQRRGLTEKTVALAEKIGCPVVSSFLARGTFPPKHPQYLGTYLGFASEPVVREAVERSDCLLMLGVLFSDTNMAARLRGISPKKVIQCIGGELLIGHHKYERVPLSHLLDQVLEKYRGKIKKGTVLPHHKSPLPTAPPPGAPIKIQDVVDLLNNFLKTEKQMIVIADTGDALLASYEIESERVMASTYYATMGFAVPSALGVQLGTGERPIVLVGDGAFQMTGPEISHCRRYGINPIIIILNNQSWVMLETFLPEAKYNKLVNWPYAEMARLWGGNGFRVKTASEFKEAVQKAYRSDQFSLIEVLLQPRDITRTLKRFAEEI